MSDIHSHSEVKIGSDRTFGLVLAAALAVLALIPLLHGAGIRLVPAAAAIALAAVAIISPQLLAPLNRLWFRLGLLIGSVVTPVVMSIIFVVAVIPTAVVRRRAGHDDLGLKPDPSATSWWVARNEDGEDIRQSMSRQY